MSGGKWDRKSSAKSPNDNNAFHYEHNGYILRNNGMLKMKSNEGEYLMLTEQRVTEIINMHGKNNSTVSTVYNQNIFIAPGVFGIENSIMNKILIMASRFWCWICGIAGVKCFETLDIDGFSG